MSLIYLAFANDKQNPLPMLREEEDKIYSYLIRRAQQGHFDIQKDSFATTEKIIEYLNLFKDEISIFHYSGHAGRDGLFLEDRKAFSKGIADLLAQCPKLKLVVLNGCATQGQLEELVKLKRNPTIIYTHAPVEDEAATRFSIAFYQSLCELYEPVKSAFNAGIAASKVVNPEIRPNRSLDWMNLEEPEILWGIHGADVFNLEWKLPSKERSTGNAANVTNEHLLESLIEPLARFNKEVDRVWSKEKERKAVNILDRREAILKAFPLPLSEQLRKLIVPEKEDAHIYYDQVGKPRLQQLITTYTTFIELLSFSLLAQLWEEFSTDRLKEIDPIYKERFSRLFQLDLNDRIAFDFLEIIRSVIAIFDQHKIDYYFEELRKLKGELDSNVVFKESTHWMNTLNKRFNRIEGASIEESEIEHLCIEAEKHLATVLSKLCFFANYKIVCVKDIGVLKYRHRKKPTFRHKVVRLIQRFVGLEEQYDERPTFLESASVLFMKDDNSNKPLNLTPFIIDHNAFDEKAPLSKLHYFDRYQKEMDAYAYKHVYKPDDMPLLIRGESHFEIIKEQFNDFSNLVFNRAIQQL